MTRQYETSRTCPECGRDVDLRNVKPGGQTFCRNKESHPGKAVVLRRRLVPAPWRAELAAADAAAEAADPVTRWAAEPPGVLDWRAQLGAACPTATPCDDTCECGGPPIVYTADHTGTACPGCGPDCWDATPGAFTRGRAHTAATAATRTARTPAAQAELDARAREVERERARLLRAVNAAQTVKRISADSVSDLRWFAAEIERADTPARLRQLAADLDGYVIQRDSWWRPPVDVAELDDAEPDDYDDDDQDDDDAAELAPVAGYITPAGVSGPMCERCIYAGTSQPAPAVVRIRYNGAREWDACTSCAAVLARPIAGIVTQVIRRYPQPGAWTDSQYGAEAQRRLAGQRPALTAWGSDAR